MESADRLAGWTTIVAGIAAMIVGGVLESWWVAVWTAAYAAALFFVEWLVLLRAPRAHPGAADADPREPKWFGRGVTGFVTLTVAKGAVFVGIALLARLVLDDTGFAISAGTAIATGALQVLASRRNRRPTPASVASL